MLGKIESAVAGLAATRHADGESEVLEALAKHIDGIPFDVNRHRDEWAVAVDAFHLQILEMARSPALEKRVRNLWHLSDFYLFQGASNLNPEKSTSRIPNVTRLLQQSLRAASKLPNAKWNSTCGVNRDGRGLSDLIRPDCYCSASAIASEKGSIE